MIVRQVGRTVADFERTGKQVLTLFSLDKRAKEGDAAAAVDALLARMDLGIVKSEDAQARFKTLKPNAEQKKRHQALLYDLEIREAAAAAKNEKAARELGKRFWADYKAKKRPTGDTPFAIFWSHVFAYARSEKEVEPYEAGLAAYEERHGKDPAQRGTIDKIRGELQALKKK